MTTLRKILLVFALGWTVGPLGAAEIFLRAGGWWINPEARGFSSQAGPAAEVGAVFDALRHHQVSLEVAHVPWEMDRRFTALAPGALLGSTGEGHLTPVLAGYRYSLRDGAARWRPFVGVAAGATKVSGRSETFLSGLAWGGEVERWAATFAGSAGIAVELRPRLSLELGYRYLHLEDVTYPTAMFRGVLGFTGGPGPTESFAATRHHVVALSLGFRF